MQKNQFFSLVASVILHAFALYLISSKLSHPPEFTVKQGESNTEVDLVAAAPQPEAPPPKPVELPPPAPQIEEKPKPDDVIKPEPLVEQKQTEVKPTPIPIPEKKEIPPSEKLRPEARKNIIQQPQGHGEITSSSKRGASTVASPNYLENPPPVYPESSRQLRQQGVVILLVKVSATGAPTNITIKTSSGFAKLDRAAIQAVKGWKFKPATLGGIPVDSSVEVPVRFELTS
jgi:protein TonB